MSEARPVRKVVLDVDPGIDSAVALSIALFDPRLEVLAVTAVAGNVSAEQATRNVQAIIEQLDPPRWPRIGAAVEPDRAPAETLGHLGGPDGLGGIEFPVAELHQRHISEKVLLDVVRTAPGEVTIVTLGPLTNIGRCLRRDANFAGQIGQLLIAGGTYEAPGDVSPAAEFNMYFDPQAARDAIRCRATKTLLPIDVLAKPSFSYDLLERLPDEGSKVGRLLRKTLPYYFRAHRQYLGLESVRLSDALAVLALLEPELFTTQRAAVDVEIAGELTTGATVFDRRSRPQWTGTLDVAVDVNETGVYDALLTALERAARGE